MGATTEQPARQSAISLRARLALALAAALVLAALAIEASPAGGSGPATNALASSSGHDRGDPRGNPRAGLTPFRSCERLRGYVRAHRRSLPGTIGGGSGAGPIADPGTGAGAGGPAGAAPESGSPAEAPSSSTNVQEQGVDEPDIVKGDPARGLAFTLFEGRLRAIDVSAEAPVELGSLALAESGGGGAGFAGARMLLAGGKAFVIASEFAAVPDMPAPAPGVEARSVAPWGVSRTLISEVDVSDPAAMRVVRTLKVEGSYLSARLSATGVRIVVSAVPDVPAAGAEGRGRSWLPRLVLREAESGERRRRPLVGCRAVSRSRRFSGIEMLSVLTFEPERGLEQPDVDAVAGSGEIVYGSPGGLYVATGRWLDPLAERRLDEDRISDVETEIHRFDASQAGVTEYRASGSVPGFMLSQWSMSEHEGVLRVASTTLPPWAGGGGDERSQSFVTVLEERDGRLAEVGSVGGLGRDEQIYAVRFIGDVGYVVTFRRIDPLYAIDLSDPARPRVGGELEIPGYSAYLHPVGDGRLLGIGQDATEEGRVLGAQASLFDVGDLSAPTRLDQEGLGADSFSEVEHDHHAFLFSAPHELAVVPLEVWRGGEDDFHGAVGLRIAAGQQIDPIARIEHGPRPEAQIRRSLILGGRLLTFSARGAMSHHPGTLAELGFLEY